jgi:hypothetical protein
VTIAIRPSCRVGWRIEALIWVGTKGEYLFADDWTAQITLIQKANLASARKALATVAMAKAGFTGLVFTFLLPGVAQAYWIREVWSATGTLSHPLVLICAAWLALLAIWIVAKAMLVNGHRAQSN